MGVNEIDRIQSILESKYKEKGYITPEEILKIIEENNISVFQVDKITNRLLLKGIMIIDDPNNIEETEIEDWSHLNYDDILNKAITIEPELKQYINLIRNIRPPQKGEEKNLLFQAKEGNEYARDRIIEMYLKNIVKIAIDYHERYGFNLSDIIEVGNIGLIKALYKIDISINERLSVYMYFRIKTEIDRRMIFSNSAIYFPVHIKEKLLPMLEVIKKNYYTEDNLNEELIQEIKQKTNMDEEEIKQFYILMQDTFDIDTLDEEYFSDKNIQINNIDNNFLKSDLKIVLGELKERETEVLKLRYGVLDAGNEKTLNEVGQILGVTRERIRQIEENALRKLKSPKLSKRLKDYI